jgi:hypothetical protein
MLTECCKNGLVERRPDGALVVPGVRVKHAKLRGWAVPPWVLLGGEIEKRERGEEMERPQAAPPPEASGPPEGAKPVFNKLAWMEESRARRRGSGPPAPGPLFQPGPILPPPKPAYVQKAELAASLRRQAAVAQSRGHVVAAATLRAQANRVDPPGATEEPNETLPPAETTEQPKDTLEPAETVGVKSKSL